MIDWTQVSIGTSALLVFFALVRMMIREFTSRVKALSSDHKNERDEWRKTNERQQKRADDIQQNSNLVIGELSEVIKESLQENRQQRSKEE